jgi:hypothetical protein
MSHPFSVERMVADDGCLQIPTLGLRRRRSPPRYTILSS